MRLKEEVLRHVGRVTALARSGPDGFAQLGSPRLGASWHRSLTEHGLDPGQSTLPRVLSTAAVRDHQERLESFLRIARHGVGKLHEEVRDSRYCVMLTNADGVTIDIRTDPALDREFTDEGFRMGTCWAEAHEGTNGIGTAIMDRAPIMVHKTEHFRAHNIAFTCSAAPIFGPDAELVAVLDASALYSPDDRSSQGLVFRLVTQSARLIENAFFLDSFRSSWILQLSREREFLDVQMDYLVAFDGAGRLVGANRMARAELLGREAGSSPRLDELFDLGADAAIALAREKPGLAIPIHLRAGGERLFALIRAPASSMTRFGSRAARSLPAEPPEARPAAGGFAGLVVADPRVASAVERARRLVDRKVPILLLGETGTGKDAFATAIHESSARRDRPFVALNCAALPEGLIEAELFGYREGAFTGARARGTKGKIALASGGTLFLDEIGDMPLPLQTRLLRVLASGEVLPLGASAPERLDLNVICATHRDLAALVREGRFREDLFYRLNAAVFHLPPLRERSDAHDVVARVFQEEVSLAGRPLALPEPLALRLAACRWPGNIRQLRNALRYAIAVCEGMALGPDHLPEGILQESPPDEAQPAAPGPRLAPPPPLAALAERDALLATLRQNRWRVAASARQLGISRATLYRKMSHHRIALPNWNVGDA